MPWLPTALPGLTVWEPYSPDASGEAARAWRRIVAASRIYRAVRLWWLRLRDGRATSRASLCPPNAALQAAPERLPDGRQRTDHNASSQDVGLRETLARNDLGRQASLHAQLVLSVWGDDGNLRPTRKRSRHDTVVKYIHSTLRLCAIMDTTDLDRAATKAFGTAVIQAHHAYARRATVPPPDLTHALQGPQTERVRESTAADLAVARREAYREKFGKVWLTRELIEIESSFRSVRREIAKIQN